MLNKFRTIVHRDAFRNKTSNKNHEASPVVEFTAAYRNVTDVVEYRKISNVSRTKLKS